MKRCCGNSRGFTLVELMSYMALFGVILSVIYSIYYQFSRTLAAAEITMLKERKAFSAVQRMQDDFRRSKSVLGTFGPFNSSSKCLILNTSPEETVIYKYDTSKSALTRYQYNSIQAESIPSSIVVGEGIRKFSYSLSKEKASLLRVSFELKEGPFGILSRRPLQFAVAKRNG